MEKIQSNFIGHIAKSVLDKETRVKISGKSSKGIFLKTSTRWILFVSFEKFRNPLALNLLSTAQLPDNPHGTQIEISNRRLIFPNHDFEISLENAALWDGLDIETNKTPISQEKITTSLIRINDPLLNHILSSSKPDQPSSTLEKSITSLCAALPQKDPKKISELASSLLGLGIGLTPEGDDFITGLLFAMYSNQANLPDWKKQLFESISKMAYQKTNTISANLIECAQNGRADERLALAYQAIKFNREDLEQAIQDLRQWGNTSGRMALLGISTGILFDPAWRQTAGWS